MRIKNFKIKITKGNLISKDINFLSIYYGDREFHISQIHKGDSGRLKYITKYVKPSWSSTNHILLNRIPIIKHKIWWRFTKLYLNRVNQSYKICQVCGEGISKYRIRDPNHGHGNTKLNCCQKCVNFYDWRWSQRKIVMWRNKKPILEHERDTCGRW